MWVQIHMRVAWIGLLGVVAGCSPHGGTSSEPVPQLSATEAPEMSARYDEATRRVIERRLGVDFVRALEASEHLIAEGPRPLPTAGDADAVEVSRRETLIGVARAELIALLYAETVAWNEIPPCKCDPEAWEFTWTVHVPDTHAAVGFSSVEIITRVGDDRGGLRHHEFDVSRIESILRRS